MPNCPSLSQSTHPILQVSGRHDPTITSADDGPPVQAGRKQHEKATAAQDRAQCPSPTHWWRFLWNQSPPRGSFIPEARSPAGPWSSHLRVQPLCLAVLAQHCPRGTHLASVPRKKEGEPARGVKPKRIRLCPCLLHFQDRRGPASCDAESRGRRGETETVGERGATWQPQEARPRR